MVAILFLPLEQLKSMTTRPLKPLQTLWKIIWLRNSLLRIERILTDCGTEYTTWHEEAIPNHEFKKTCKKLGIKHTTTNGYVERLNKTLLDEFYSVAFRKKRYESIEALQIDLDNF